MLFRLFINESIGMLLQDILMQRFFKTKVRLYLYIKQLNVSAIS